MEGADEVHSRDDLIGKARIISSLLHPTLTSNTNLEWEGDSEIEVTPWQEVNQGVGATRTIHFVTSLEVRFG